MDEYGRRRKEFNVMRRKKNRNRKSKDMGYSTG